MDERLTVEEAARRLRAARAAGLPIEPGFVLHDLDRVAARLARLRSTFPAGTTHAVAVKANPVLGVLRAVVRAGAGLEAASPGELALAAAAGCPPERVVYDAPARTDAELVDALARGVLVHAAHLAEVERLAALGVPDGARVGLRVNPGSGAGRIPATAVGRPDGRFGEPIVHEAAITAAFARHRWLGGLQVHAGSQGVDLERVVAAGTAALRLAERLEAAVGRPSWVDVGGGVPVAYRDEDRPPPIEAWSRGLARGGTLRGRSLITEPGRWVHAGAGAAFARVVHVGPGRVTVTLGTELIPRPVHALVVLDPDGVPRVGEPAPCDVFGPLCFEGDRIGHRAPLVDPRPGDWLLIRDAGAYTLGAWSRLCARPTPAVVGVEDGVPVLLSARETDAELVAGWARGVTGPGRGA